MPRYENNMKRSEGNYTSSRLPHENDNGSFRRDAWEKIDNLDASERDMGNQLTRPEERGSYYGKGPRGWKRSDERICEDVNEALYRSYDVDASDIEVAVLEGVVTLTGSVKNRKEKREAEFCAEAVSGVVDVRNEIQLQR